MANVLYGKFRQSIFPDYPRGSKIAKQDGTMTEAWHLALSNLFQNLQKTFSNEGFQLPYLSSTDLATIQQIYTNLIGKKLSDTNPSTPNITGKIVYDIDTKSLKIFIIDFLTPGDFSSAIGPNTGWKSLDYQFTPPFYTATQLATILAPYTAIIGSPLGNLPNITGEMVYDITNEVPKIFILNFAIPGDFSSNVTGASWKTFTLI